MHLLLTDRLACPRCGPAHGLILLADRVEERRVLGGTLGCSNCREGFPVVDGFGDLRPPPREALPPAEPFEPPAEEETVRLAALLGVAEGPGFLLLAGRLAAHADVLAEMVSGIEVVAASPALCGRPERPGVSRVAVGPTLPFFPAAMRGVALPGPEVEGWLDEAVRVLAPGARIVVPEPAEDTADLLRRRGLELALEDPEGVVATGP